jgi:predicted nucleic acid-binding protein
MRAHFRRKLPSMTEAEQPAEPSAVVLDTNAVLDWLVFNDSRMAPLASVIESGLARWLTVGRMRSEFARVIGRPPLARRAAHSEWLLSTFDRLSVSCADPARASSALRCRDLDDQIFVDLSIAQKARWLVTRDKALLALRRKAARQGLSILVPEAWSPPAPTPPEARPAFAS